MYLTYQEKLQFNSDSRGREIDFVFLVRKSAKPNCKKPAIRSNVASWPFFLQSPRGGYLASIVYHSAKLH